MTRFARLALELHPLEESLLQALASYPLLCASQLAWLLDADLSNVTKGCKRLYALGFIETHRAAQPSRDLAGRRVPLAYYLLTSLAIRYLAAQAAVGSTIAVKRYLRARHWEHGFARLRRQFNHTRVMNTFFVEMFKSTQARGMELLWRSEFDARVYFKSNYHPYLERRPHLEYKPYSHARRGEWFRSFHRSKIFALMPDGSGVIRTGNARYAFALEVDLTRSARDKLARKLREYLLAQMEEQFHGTILVLTTSWQRARTWQRVARGLFGLEAAHPYAAEEQAVLVETAASTLPLWITTIQMVEEQGVGEPIWWKIWESEELTKLEWFR